MILRTSMFDGVTALADVERLTILRVIKKSAGNKTTAARLLGISRPTLYRKLWQYQTKTSRRAVRD